MAYPERSFLQRSLVSDAPKSALRSRSRYPDFTEPLNEGNRDWQGIINSQRRDLNSTVSVSRLTAADVPSDVNCSVSVLVPKESRGREHVGRAAHLPATARDRPDYLLDHQAFLESRRVEYERRLEAERRGVVHMPRPYSSGFVGTLPLNDSHVPNFETRGRGLPKPKIVGTKDELAWLSPPVIPPPVGFNGFWDACAGHESIIQVMALSGANPDNSPSLTSHFMYPDLLSSIQRLQYGTYLIHYQKSETPHERYFYIKSLPLANRGQFCPFFCWSVHRHSQTAVDAIPLCNVMWVTQGIDGSDVFKKHYIGGNYIHGPFVDKYRSECLVHGSMTVWVYDGKKLRGIDILATDPLVFALWMTLLEDFSQLNAALDPTGNVRALQKDIEGAKADGRLAEHYSKKRDKSLFK